MPAHPFAPAPNKGCLIWVSTMKKEKPVGLFYRILGAFGKVKRRAREPIKKAFTMRRRTTAGHLEARRLPKVEAARWKMPVGGAFLRQTRRSPAWHSFADGRNLERLAAVKTCSGGMSRSLPEP